MLLKSSCLGEMIVLPLEDLIQVQEYGQKLPNGRVRKLKKGLHLQIILDLAGAQAAKFLLKKLA